MMNTFFFRGLKLIVIISLILIPVNSMPHISDSSLRDKSYNHSSAPVDSSKISFYLDTAVLGSFHFPIQGKVISHFGYRGKRMHTGTDIKLTLGDTVCAAFKGVVTRSMHYYGYGILVVLQHPDNIETYYSHLSKAIVNVGDTVLSGIPLGLGGRTGRATTTHLHFEIRKNKKALNAEKLFDFENQIVRSLVIEKKPDKVKKESVIFSNEEDSLKSEIPQIAPIYHKIKKGDTLYSLAKSYGTTVDSICKTNGIRPKSILKLGTRLKMN